MKGIAMKKIVFALLASSFSMAVSAVTCYQIFSPKNELVWQRTSPPVRMDSQSINEQIAKMVPNGHLIIVDDNKVPCHSINKIPAKAKKPSKGQKRTSG